MTENKSLLTVRDLRVYFKLDEGVVKSVDGVSFDAYPGQVVGIVGESGCGKSVTMKAILKIVEPPGKIMGGTVRLQDRTDPEKYHDLTAMDEKGKEIRAIRGGEIALIPQEPMAAFSPVHTIGDQIIEAIMLHSDISKEKAREQCIQALAAVGMSMPEKRVDSYTWQLSGGLRQRAIIAMAISSNPRLLIADEPTTAIDVTTQAQILKLLKQLQKERNMSIIFITHDLGVIAQMAQYVVVMYLGRVMERGPVDEIFHNPKHPYTQALLRSIPSAQKTTRVKLPTISGSIPHPFNKPKGCPFHPRCTQWVRGVCEVETPDETFVNENHFVHCFLYEKSKEAAS
jgi:peptide/nickel transport system ATP-binding protein